MKIRKKQQGSNASFKEKSEMPSIPNPDISSFLITDLMETKLGVRHLFSFKINGLNYFMMIIEDVYDKNADTTIAEIVRIKHEEDECPFCGPNVEIKKDCQVLKNHALELFQRILPHSKKRLKWVLKEVSIRT